MPTWPRSSGWCGTPRAWTSLTTSTALWRGASNAAWRFAASTVWKNIAGISNRTARKPPSCARTVSSPLPLSFGNRRVFEELKRTVFPALVENRAPADPIRIWVPGCASGEEAYSIAICLKEFLDETGANFPWKSSLPISARRPLKRPAPASTRVGALSHVSPQRLARFFTPVERSYQIASSIRDVCVFARHNVAQDTPFSKLDLISCCNLADLPWRRITAQGLVDPALRPQAERLPDPRSLGECRREFRLVSPVGQESQDLFHAAGRRVRRPCRPGMASRTEDRAVIREKVTAQRSGLDVQREADRLMLAEYAPPGVIVDANLSIVQVRGRTAPYLEISPGEPTNNLLKMACEGLIAGHWQGVPHRSETHMAAR